MKDFIILEVKYEDKNIELLFTNNKSTTNSLDKLNSLVYSDNYTASFNKNDLKQKPLILAIIAGLIVLIFIITIFTGF